MAVRAYTDAKGRRRYEVEFEARGHRVHRRAPPGTTQAQAAEWELRLRREVFDAAELGKKPEVLLTSVVQDWLDTRPRKNHRVVVSQANLLHQYIDRKMTSDAPEAARSARQAWAKGGLATATINSRVLVLKAALTVAGYKELAAEIPVPNPHNEKELYLTREQVKAWADAAEERIGASIWIAAYTGMRAAELLSSSGPVDGAFRVLGKGRGKGKYRVIPVAKPVLPYLWALPVGIAYRTWHRDLTDARDVAGLPKTVTPHTLRHSFAAWMVRLGVDLLTLSKLMGHANISTTAHRYGHLYTDALTRAMGKLR